MFATLHVTKDGVGGDLIVEVGRRHSWHCAAPSPWFPAERGNWVRGRNATKFRQFTYLSLLDTTGREVARMPDQPWRSQAHLQCNLTDHLWVFQASGAPYDAVMVVGPPLSKRFRLREMFDGAIGYGVIGPAGELAFFQIADPDASIAATYVFRATGIGVGLPFKRLPSWSPSASTPGPWNDFDAPGWMTVSDFDGDAMMQSAVALPYVSGASYTDLQFVGHVDDAVGYLCHIANMSTGRTFSLPSVTITSGGMSMMGQPAAFTSTP
jgi:hypothetical protein